MDFTYVAKVVGPIASALVAWWGYRKFRALLNTYREVLGPRKAQPFVSLKYRWSGDLLSPKSHILVLHLGNRERRPIIIHELRWLAPPFRLTWATETRSQVLHPRIEEGAGIEVELDPSLVFSSVKETRYFKGWFRKVLLVCELRLAVYLQSGEVIAKRIPSSMRFFLAMQSGFSKLSRGIIRAHAYIWP